MRHMRHKNLNYEAEMPSTFLAIKSTIYLNMLLFLPKRHITNNSRMALFMRDEFLFQSDDHCKYFQNKNTHTMLCVCLNNKCFCLQMLNTTH